MGTRQAGPGQRLNPLAAGLPTSATLAINERCARLRAAGREIFQFGFGQSPFPVPGRVVEALREHAHEKAYLPVQGLPALRESISNFLQRTEGLGVDPGQVLIGPGSKELMYILQLALDAEVLLPSPSWVSYAPQAKLTGRNLRWLSCESDDGWRLTPSRLAQALAAPAAAPERLLILNYPGNPTGVSYSADELAALAAVAAEHEVLILSDEIYSGLHFRGEHVSIARFYPAGTIITNGLSKWCGAGGWRLGLAVLPARLDRLRAAMLAIASETFSSVTAPVQYAAITAFAGGDETERYMADARAILKALAAHCAQQLRAAGADVCDTDGGFYLFPVFSDAHPRFTRIGRPHDSATLCERVLDETGVAMLPGSDFGRPDGELSVRLAFVDFDGSSALSALSAGAKPDKSFLERYCSRVIDGIERLCTWLSGD